MNKIFGIGLNKTATRSLADALRILGFRTLHKGDAATSALVDAARDQGRPLLSLIGEHFDAYLDVAAIVHGFRELDEQYTDSRFILTTRDLDDWLASRTRHVEANRRRAERGEYEGDWLVEDREAWIDERERHHETVARYFHGRPDDLLVMDIPGGDGWEELAPFLDRPLPSAPFPWENRRGTGTYRRVEVGDRIRRLVRLTRARFVRPFRR